jgi:hypothetical protein
MNVDLRLSTAYHPETDGATERFNRTITQMLRNCVALAQIDWAFKLPAIEFALNSARSSVTGFSPFFLNTGRPAPPMNWHIPDDAFPGVRKFAQTIQDAIVQAHDSILEARVKQTTPKINIVDPRPSRSAIWCTYQLKTSRSRPTARGS